MTVRLETAGVHTFIRLVAISCSILLGGDTWGASSSGGDPGTGQDLAEQGLTDEVVVGSAGGLIAWDVQTGRAFVLGAPPEWPVVKELGGPEGPQLAISPGGDRAFLSRDRRGVEIHRSDGGRRVVDLDGEVGGVIWLDDRRLAVSPTNGDHLIEIWDIEDGERVRQIQPVPGIPETPGFRVLRTTGLAWDAERRRLHALDTFTGRYGVYELADPPTGRGAAPVLDVQIDDRSRGGYDEWIERTDRQLAARGEFQGSTIWRFSVALDAQGTAWMVERCAGEEDGATEETAHLLAVDRQGAEHRRTVETLCCSLEATPWRDLLVFARSATPREPGCFATVRRPRVGASAASGFWLEATPLSPVDGRRGRGGAYPPATRHRVPKGGDPTAVQAFVDALEPGSVLLCTGGEPRPLHCREIWIDSDAGVQEDLGLGEDAARTGRPVRGRISTEGEGVPGAAVALVPAELRTTRLVTLPLAWPEGAEAPIREVVTRADGGFTLPELAPGDYRLLVRLPGGRMDHGTTFAVTAPRLEGAGEPAALDLGSIEFPAGLRLEVVVTDPAGRPIPEAFAGAAQEETAPQAVPGAATLFQAEAGEDGRAVIEGLEPDRPVVVTCRAPGHGPWREAFDLPPVLVECPLEPLGGIEGRVVDERGEPVTEGRVTLTGGAGFHTGSVETAILATEDEGRFRFDELEPARFRLVAASPGRAAHSLSVPLGSGEDVDLGDLALEPGARWVHRVVAPSPERPTQDVEPVAGAALTAVSPPGSMRPAATDAWGEAEVEGPSDGRLVIEVRAPGFAVRRVEVPESARAPGAEPHEIVLEGGGWIAATVWDEETGAPCVGCRITLSGSGPAETLVTAGSGAARSGPLAPGVWRASLTRIQGFGAVVTRSGGHDVRTVTVEAGRTSEVRFGEPEETVEVVVVPAPADGAAWRLAVRDGAGASRLHPLDGSGSATVPRPAGGAALSLSRPGITVELGRLAEDTADPAVIERPSGLLTGLLARAGAGGAREGGRSPGPSRLELVDLATGRPVAHVDTRPGAPFRIPFLATGTYALGSGGEILVTAAVVDGQETALGELE